MRAIIKRAVGSVFLALDGKEEVYLHSPKKIKHTSILRPGDHVEYERMDCVNLITRILPRKNAFLRPKVCNIDNVFIVCSMVSPCFDPHLADKLSVHAVRAGALPIFLFTKADEQPVQASICRDLYRSIGFSAFISGLGWSIPNELLTLCAGKVNLLVGNSGVGKSTFLNTMAGEHIQETQETSLKLGRGKHTTRHGELFQIGDALMMDTPGFSAIEVGHFPEGKSLGEYFPEFQHYAGLCHFSSCLHDREPQCAVREAVECGEIPRSRYESYILMLSEQREEEKRKW